MFLLLNKRAGKLCFYAGYLSENVFNGLILSFGVREGVDIQNTILFLVLILVTECVVIMLLVLPEPH